MGKISEHLWTAWLNKSKNRSTLKMYRIWKDSRRTKIANAHGKALCLEVTFARSNTKHGLSNDKPSGQLSSRKDSHYLVVIVFQK